MKVTDPDNLDRFQIAIDPVGQIISVRGLGTQRHAVDQTGDSDGTTTFTDAGANFTTDGVQIGDVLTIISDPSENGGIIGHYRITTVGTTTVVVDRAITASTSANLTYKINAPQTVGPASPQVADGVNLDALHSFFKEEWITLAAGLGNAEDLNQFTFPTRAVPAAVGQYVLGGVNGDASSAWRFADQNGTQASDLEGVPRELIRDGGWAERNASDLVLREYPNITTLGSLDADAQAYYQQGDETGSPSDFRIPGPVNQSILAFGPPITPTNIAFAATTITRSAGSWIDDNYRIGDYVTIRSAEDSANNGSRGPITAISATVITIASASFTVNADDDTATFLVDHRRYTKLFCRKKARSYASAVHADAGIPTTGIKPLVNSFPLGHSADPAITLDDGVLSGGDVTGTSIFQGNEGHTTNTNGVTTDLGDGTFTLASSGSTFNSTARGTVVILQAGDSLRITSGSYQGYYEIKSIDSATQLTLYHEPLRAYPGNETTLTFTAYAGVRDVGAANATLTNVSGSTGTLVSAGSTFNADNGLGDRTVAAGDIVQVFSGAAAVIGYYKVISVDSATQLTLNTSDQIFGGQTSQSYRIWRPGMFLQRFETNAVAASMTDGLNFNGAGNPDTLTRTGGSWVTDGFTPGMAITIIDAEDAANEQTMIIASVSASVITLIAEESVTTNTDDDTAVNGNVTGDTGIVRTVNGVVYPFHWRLFANGGTLAQAFQFLQMILRRPIDIDGGNGTSRGDITDLLMTYVSPNGTTLDLFPDNLSSGESNNVTYRDVSADDRNNAFLVGLIIVPNNNLINSATKRLTMYFTSVPTGDFDSNNAVIIDDSIGVDIDFTAISGNINVTYDYTNNSQGGRTPDTDAPYVLVASGTDLAQSIQLAGTISKVNSITIPVSPATEFNYSNP